MTCAQLALCTVAFLVSPCTHAAAVNSPVRRQHNVRNGPQASEPICDTSYDNGASYGKGTWIQREHGLTDFVSDRDGKVIGVQATEKGRAQIQLLRDQHEHLKSHNHNCLWRNESEAARVLASMNWDWKPADCKLGDLSFENLPTWLKSRGAKLRFYGDSLNDDMANQLISRGGFFNNSSVLVTSYRKDKLGAPTAASLFDKTDHMESFLDKLDLRDVPWADENISSADILVLNAGAHWCKSVEHTRVAFTKVARDLWELPQHKQPRAVIFRTTVMGHDKCVEFFNPLQAEEVAENKRASQHQYNWGSFAESNAAMIQAFKDVWPAERFRALDVSMFEQRGDGHNGALSSQHNGNHGVAIDCLHYCVPGPSMVWNQLLLHVLSQLPL